MSPMATNPLRREIEQDFYDFLDRCDPSGRNTERLKQLFVTMDDKQFFKYIDRFFDDPKANIQVGYLPYDNPVSVDFINKLAKAEGIPLYEIIYKPYVTGDVDDPPASIHPVLVLDVPIKRLKQMINTKNHATISATKRDAQTGQVTGSDRGGRVTDVEAYSMIVQELYACAQESYGPMADDEAAAFEMMRRIQQDGEFELADLPDDPLNRKTTNTIQYYIWGSCLVTNLLERSGYVLPITAKGNEDRATSIT